MIVGCKNCGSYFTGPEMAKRKPPIYPWKLTEAGARVLEHNVAGGEQRPCPTCGHRTLKSTTDTSKSGGESL